MRQHLRQVRERVGALNFRFVIVAGLALVAAAHDQSGTLAQGTVIVTGVAANHSSVRIYYAPVPGAKDYRVYDVANPNNVKYAGQVHLTASANCPGGACQNHFVVLPDGVTPVFPYQIASGASGGPQVLDVPATQIDWNGVGDGAQHTLVVEAVDQLGPVPPGSLYTGEDNRPLISPLPAGSMPGSNKGPTSDGKTSTNGQGPYTNNPQVIAQSPRFRVQANVNYKAVPSKAGATHTFFDTFDNSQAATQRLVSRDDRASDQFGNLGMMTFALNGGTPKAWEIEYRQADNINSMPFISADHFMDMIVAGATPGGSAPSHTLYGSMAMSPVQTFDMGAGKIAHLTMEVDGHQSFRRWLAIQIAPASDPLKGWDSSNHQINTNNQALFLEIRDGVCTLDIYTGSISGSDRRPTGTAGGSPHGARLWGQAGSSGGAPIMCGWDQMYIRKNLTKNGLGLDDKSRYDLFISQSRIAFFQDGQLIVQSAIPAGTFPWADAPLRAYFSHYLYHSNNDVDELTQFQVSGQNFCYPLNSYWFNNPVTGTSASQNVCNQAYPAGYGFPHSDERHWDNMGFEVLAASDAPSNDYSTLSSLVQPPAIELPQFVSGSYTPPTSPTNLRIVR
jgi:hypothetical protein